MRQPWAKDGKELASALCIRCKKEMSVRATTAKSFDDKTSNDLPVDYVASEEHIKAQNENRRVCLWDGCQAGWPTYGQD
jgi:hypothetical protein